MSQFQSFGKRAAGFGGGFGQQQSSSRSNSPPPKVSGKFGGFGGGGFGKTQQQQQQQPTSSTGGFGGAGFGKSQQSNITPKSTDGGDIERLMNEMSLERKSFVDVLTNVNKNMVKLVESINKSTDNIADKLSTIANIQQAIGEEIHEGIIAIKDAPGRIEQAPEGDTQKMFIDIVGAFKEKSAKSLNVVIGDEIGQETVELLKQAIASVQEKIPIAIVSVDEFFALDQE